MNSRMFIHILIEMKQVLPSCRDITPVFKKVFLDIHVIGLRNLKYKRNKIRLT